MEVTKSSNENLTYQDSLKERCMTKVQSVFPDICPAELRHLAEMYDNVPESIVNHLLDEQQNGLSYPRASTKTLKRKRDMDEDLIEDEIKNEHALDEDRKTYSQDRQGNSKKQRVNMIRSMISDDFPLVPLKAIQTILAQNNHLLYQGYLAIFEATLIEDDRSRGWSLVKRNTRTIQQRWLPEVIEHSISTCNDDVERTYMQELVAARRAKALRARKEDNARKLREAENKNREESEAAGLMFSCECCFSEEPANRMITCLDYNQHWFCYECVRQQAAAQIGLSRFKLTCFAVGDCPAGFAPSDIRAVLNPKTIMALERLEQQDMLANAGLENIVSCPFCPFAAESSPVEVDKEFRCLNPECGQVSCRLCEKPSHVPKLCEDAARDRERDQGETARKAIEEAMSKAMIRHCNKCKTPFIKEYGCNKMVCPKPDCHNIQCYVCSQSCNYQHFDDRDRGGKAGNCPLWDDVDERHDAEVKKAEAAARKQVEEANPGLRPQDLSINMSERVAEDDARRATNNPTTAHLRAYGGPDRRAQLRPGPPGVNPNVPQQRNGQGPVNFRRYIRGRLQARNLIHPNPPVQQLVVPQAPVIPFVMPPPPQPYLGVRPLINAQPFHQPMQYIRNRALAARRAFRKQHYAANAPGGQMPPQQQQPQPQPQPQPPPLQQQQGNLEAPAALLPFGYIDPRYIGLRGN